MAMYKLYVYKKKKKKEKNDVVLSSINISS